LGAGDHNCAPPTVRARPEEILAFLWDPMRRSARREDDLEKSVLNSALLLLMWSLSAAMLMLVKKRYFVLYMAGEMALYLLQKVFRGDFHYWLPIDGAFGLFASLVLRVIVKTVTDFTGVIHVLKVRDYWNEVTDSTSCRVSSFSENLARVHPTN